MAEESTNTMHNMMTSDYGDGKLSKEKELNSSMSINTSNSSDDYTKAIETTKGGN